MTDATERPLSARERAVIDFEREWFTVPGPKDANLRRMLGISPSTYRRTLLAAIERRAAFVYDPLTVSRASPARRPAARPPRRSARRPQPSLTV